MKSYQCVPRAVLFAYKWHNIITLSGVYLGGVNISLSALSRRCDTRKRDANWREESIFMWRLTFNYVWGGGGGIRLGGAPRNVWKQHFAEPATLKAAEDVIWMAVWGPCWMALLLLWMESLCYDLRVIGCPEWSVDREGEARLTKKEIKKIKAIDSDAGRQREENITYNENKWENDAMDRPDAGKEEQQGKWGGGELMPKAAIHHVAQVCSDCGHRAK